MYVVSNLPYKSAIDNYRTVLILFGELVLIYVANYFRNYVYADGINIEYKSQYNYPDFDTFERGKVPALA